MTSYFLDTVAYNYCGTLCWYVLGKINADSPCEARGGGHLPVFVKPTIVLD